MTRRLATFTLGLLAGAALALLLTSPATSRQPSAPRPVLSAPGVLPLQGDVATGDAASGRTGVPSAGHGATPSPTIVKQDASPEVQPSAKPTAAPTPRPRATTRPVEPRRGVASWVAASYGADYLAARLPRGTRLRVCGLVGCITGTVNDYGPSKRIHPDRIVDLSRADFWAVCGDPVLLGVCPVRVTVR